MATAALLPTTTTNKSKTMPHIEANVPKAPPEAASPETNRTPQEPIKKRDALHALLGLMEATARGDEPHILIDLAEAVLDSSYAWLLAKASAHTNPDVTNVDVDHGA